MDVPLLRHPSRQSSDDSGPVPDLGPSSVELVERYLDGLLDERERRVFENSLESDPVLRRHLEMQRRIDERLRRHMAPPDSVLIDAFASMSMAGAAPVAAHSPPPDGARRATPTRRATARNVNWLRVAALVALFMSGYLLYLNLTAPPTPKPPPIAFVEPSTAYAQVVSGGMKPDVVCTTAEAFETFTKQTLGAALAVQREFSTSV